MIESTGEGASIVALKHMGRVNPSLKEYQWLHQMVTLSPQKEWNKNKNKKNTYFFLGTTVHLVVPMYIQLDP